MHEKQQGVLSCMTSMHAQQHVQQMQMGWPTCCHACSIFWPPALSDVKSASSAEAVSLCIHET